MKWTSTNITICISKSTFYGISKIHDFWKEEEKSIRNNIPHAPFLTAANSGPSSHENPPIDLEEG